MSGADANATVREYLVWPAESPRAIAPMFGHLNNLHGRQYVHWNQRPESQVETAHMARAIRRFADSFNNYK